MNFMLAKYAGTCAACGGKIKKYDAIAYCRHTRKAYHETCAPAPTEAQKAEHERQNIMAYVAAGLGEI